MVELFVRKFEWSRTEIGVTYGLIAIFVGIAGSVWSGWYAGRLLARRQGDAPMRIALWSALGLAPLAVVMPLLSDGMVAAVLLIPISFCMAMPPGLSNVALQAIAPNRMRGQLIALYLISVSFLSYLLAPLIIGLMNDFVFRSESAIDLSMSTLAVINYGIAIICLSRSLRPLREALDRVASEEFTA